MLLNAVYFLINGVFVFLLALFLTMRVGSALGPGDYEVGYVVVALALLIAVVVVCTFFIVDAIKSTKE